MRVDMTRAERLELLADALRIARERGMRDYALGVAEAAEDWLAQQTEGDPDVACAVRLLRIAIDDARERALQP